MAYQSQLGLMHQLFQQTHTRKPHWTWQTILHVYLPAQRVNTLVDPLFFGATNPDFIQYRAELQIWRNLCKSSSLLLVSQKSLLTYRRVPAWRRRTSIPGDRTANASPTSHTLLPEYYHLSSFSSSSSRIPNTSTIRTHNPSPTTTTTATVSPANRCSTSYYQPSTRDCRSSTSIPSSSHGSWVCPRCSCSLGANMA
jgi:hypothetical protein